MEQLTKRQLLRKRRELRDTANEWRQDPDEIFTGIPKREFANILGFNRHFGTDTDETYRILDRLSKTDRYDDVENRAELLTLLAEYDGLVKVFLMAENGFVREFMYDMNNFDVDARYYDWRATNRDDYNRDVFEELQEAGLIYRVFVSPFQEVSAQQIRQSYLDGGYRHCVLDAILEKMGNPTTNQKPLIKKIQKLKLKYANGVPEDEMDKVMKGLRIKATICVPLLELTRTYGETDNKKYLLTINYMNTRLNHLDIIFEKVRAVVSQQVFDDVGECFYEKTKCGKIYKKICKNTTFTLEDDEYQKLAKKFNEQFDGMKICDIQDAEISKYIRSGTRQTGSPYSKIWGEIEYDEIHHIDQKNAYANFHGKYYSGFVGKLTDIRQTDRLEGEGFYHIINVKLFGKLAEIDTYFPAIRDGVYPKPFCVFLQDHATFEIVSGCWGMRHDFNFPQEFYGKQDGIRHYARWIGVQSMPSTTRRLYTKTTKEFASILANYHNVSQNATETIISFPKTKNYHMSHISGYLYAYQQLGLYEQLLEMDMTKVLKIQTDGIYYCHHDFKMTDKFVVKEGKSFYQEGSPYLLYIDKPPIVDYPPRPHFSRELFMGVGGSGKTHYNLTDKGLIRPIFVAPSNKLKARKMAEYSCDGAVIHAFLVDEKNQEISESRIKQLLQKYNVLIVDEASMIGEKVRAKLFELPVKLIFCGDLANQLLPVGDKLLNVGTFDNIQYFNTNYRCKCEQLKKVLGELIRKEFIDVAVSTLDDYTREDYIICHQHTTIEKINSTLKIEPKYLVEKMHGEHHKGDLLLKKPTFKCKETHALTCHSLQGETILSKIFIHIECLKDIRLLYTAISRAEYFSQIRFIN